MLGLLYRIFVCLYHLEICEEDAFLLWKDHVNELLPGKETALFHVVKLLSWLDEAEVESDGLDTPPNQDGLS
jgi:hypothetical protein